MVTARSTGSLSDQVRNNFSNYLKDFGTTVTVTRTTETRDSMERITSQTTSSSTVTADIQWVTKYDLKHLNLGSAEEGDGMLFVEYSAAVGVHDKVTFNNVDYIVNAQIEGELIAGSVAYKGFIIKLFGSVTGGSGETEIVEPIG